MTDYRNGIDLESRTKMYKDAQQKGDKDRLVVWAGVGAGLVNKIESASVRPYPPFPSNLAW